VTVSLGDHCAAAEIKAAVNNGRPFAKGFLGRQERLLRRPRQSRMTWSFEKSSADELY
jgi:hypothetical protein